MTMFAIARIPTSISPIATTNVTDMAPRNQLEEMPVLNLTSMIDVLFLLIIFFMVGTKFIENERQMTLKLPQVRQGHAVRSA